MRTLTLLSALALAYTICAGCATQTPLGSAQIGQVTPASRPSLDQAITAATPAITGLATAINPMAGLIATSVLGLAAAWLHGSATATARRQYRRGDAPGAIAAGPTAAPAVPPATALDTLVKT